MQLMLRDPNLWNVSNPLFNISKYVKGRSKLGVPTSVHNVNISSHLDASSVINVNVSLELNFIYINVYVSLHWGTLLKPKYWLDPLHKKVNEEPSMSS